VSLATSFLAFDDRLAALRVPPLTPWWRDGITEWLDAYEHGKVLELWACVGRGSAKSTALYKLALFFALFGDFAIPPGERHYAIVLSRLKEEAAKGIAIIGRWCSLLGVKHRPVGDVIELEDMPRGIRVVAASVAASSGFRAYAILKDERSKWPSEGAEERDAEEIDTSAAAMTATHPLAPVLAFGSAWGAFGGFHEAISKGSDAGRLVLGPTPTWVAAPHITEAELRRKERDPRRFAREYACVFQAEWEGGYFAGLVDACVGAHVALPYDPRFRYVVSIDQAFARDLFAISVQHAYGARVVVDRVEALTPPRAGPGLSPTACLRRVKALRDEYRAGPVLCDQHHAASLADIAEREGFTLEPTPWTATSKSERCETTRTMMRDRRLSLPNDGPLRRELAGIGVRLLPSGHEQIQARHGYTDDRVSAVVLGVSSLASVSPASRMVNALRTRGEVGPLLLARDVGDLSWAAEVAARFGYWIP